MILLGVFEFYNIDRMETSSSSDWLIILVTALLSGLTAWGAAFFQISYSDFNRFKESKETSKKIFDFVKENIQKSHTELKSLQDYIEEAINSIGYGRKYDIADKIINLSSFKSVENLQYHEFYNHIKFLGFSSENERRILNAYSSIIDSISHYLSIRDFYRLKYTEYNNLINKINLLAQAVAIKVQNLIFSEENKSFKRTLLTIPLIERNIYRKENPYFQMIDELDAITSEYQKKEKFSFPEIEEYFNKIKNLINKYKSIFPDIELAQNIITTLSYIENLKTFYSTSTTTYNWYLKVIITERENLGNIDTILVSEINVTFWKFVTGK